MFCKKCDKVMIHVMSFYDNKAYEFHRCPICWYESKKIPLIFSSDKLNQKNTEVGVKASKRKS